MSVTLHRVQGTRLGKIRQAAQLLRDTKTLLNELYPGSTEVYTEIFGNVGVVHALATFPDLGSLDQASIAILADVRYQALIERAVEEDLFIEGSIKDTLIRSIEP